MSRPIEATIVEVKIPDELGMRDGFIVIELATGERLRMRYSPDVKGALPKIGQEITLGYDEVMTLKNAGYEITSPALRQQQLQQPPAPHIDSKPQFPAKTWDNEDPFGSFEPTYSKPGGVVLIVVFNMIFSMFGLLFGFLMMSISSTTVLLGGVFFVIGVFLVVVSYGLYRLQSWARTAYMVFSVLICFTIIGAVIGVPFFIYLYGDVKNSFNQHTSENEIRASRKPRSASDGW